MDFKNLFISALFLPTILALRHDDNQLIGFHHRSPKVISFSETLPIDDNLEYYVDDANELENNRITTPNDKNQPIRKNSFTKVSESSTKKWGVNFQRRPDTINQGKIIKLNYTSNLRGSVKNQKPLGNRRISETQFGSNKRNPIYETHLQSDNNVPTEDNFQTNLPNLKQTGTSNSFNHKKFNKLGLASDKLNSEDNTILHPAGQEENEYGDELGTSEPVNSPSTARDEITDSEKANSQIGDFGDENSEDYPTSGSKIKTSVSKVDLNKQTQRQIDLSLNQTPLTATNSEDENDYDIEKTELTSSKADSTVNSLFNKDVSTEASENAKESLAQEEDLEQTTTVDSLLTPSDEVEYDEVTTILNPTSSAISPSTAPSTSVKKGIKAKPVNKINIAKTQHSDSSLTEIEDDKSINHDINEEDKKIQVNNPSSLSTEGSQSKQIVTKENLLTSTSSSLNKNKHKLLNNDEHSSESKNIIEKNQLNPYLSSTNKHIESMPSSNTNQDEEDSYYYEDEFSVASSNPTTVKPVLQTTLKTRPTMKSTINKSSLPPKITAKVSSSLQNTEQSQTNNNNDDEYYNDEDFESTSAKPISTMTSKKTPIHKISQQTTLFKKERTNEDSSTAENVEDTTMNATLLDVTTNISIDTLTTTSIPSLDNIFDDDYDENNDLLFSTESSSTEESVSTLTPNKENKVTTKKIENIKIGKDTTTKVTTIKPLTEATTEKLLLTSQNPAKTSTTKNKMTTKIESDNKKTKITKQNISKATTVKPETTTEEYDYYNDDEGSRGYHNRHKHNNKIQSFPQAKDNFVDSLEYDHTSTEKILTSAIHTTKNIYGRTRSYNKHLHKKITESLIESTSSYETTTPSNFSSESFSNNTSSTDSTVNKDGRSNVNEDDSSITTISSNETTTPTLDLTTEITTPDYVEEDYDVFHLSNPFVKKSAISESENNIDDIASSTEQTSSNKDATTEIQMTTSETSMPFTYVESNIGLIDELDLPVQKLPTNSSDKDKLTETANKQNIKLTSKHPQHKKKSNKVNNLSENLQATTRTSYHEFENLELATDSALTVQDTIDTVTDNTQDSLQMEEITTTKPIVTKLTLKPSKIKGNGKKKLSTPTPTIPQSIENSDEVDSIELTTENILPSQSNAISSGTLKPDLSTKNPLHTTSKPPANRHSVSEKASTHLEILQSTASSFEENYDYLDLTTVTPISSESRALSHITSDIQPKNISETTESTLTTQSLLMTPKPSKIKNAQNPKSNAQTKLSTSTESSIEEDYDYFLSTIESISSVPTTSPKSNSQKLEKMHKTTNSGISTKTPLEKTSKSSITKKPLNKQVSSQSSLSSSTLSSDDGNLDYLEMSSVQSIPSESSTSSSAIPDVELDEMKVTTKSALSTKASKKVTKKMTISKTKESESKKTKTESTVSTSTNFTPDELDESDVTTAASVLEGSTQQSSIKNKPKNIYEKQISSNNGKIGSKTGPVWSQHSKNNLSFSKETLSSEESSVPSLKKEGRKKPKHVYEDSPICSRKKGTINNETTVLTCKNESARFISWKGYNSLLVTVCSAEPEPYDVIFADVRPETEEQVDNSQCEMVKSSGSCVQQYMPLTAMVETEKGKFKECIKIPIKCSCHNPEENI